LAEVFIRTRQFPAVVTKAGAQPFGPFGDGVPYGDAMRPCPLATLCLVLTASVFVPLRGRAEEGLGDARLEQARESFRLGTALARQQQWREALAAFERSATLRAHPSTTFNLGFCERALGRYTRARKFFEQALHASDEGPTDGLPEDVREETRAYLAEIDRLLVRARVTVDPPDAEIGVDNRPLEVAAASPLTLAAGTLALGDPLPAPAGRFVLLLDPGDHVVVVSRAEAGQRVTRHRFEAGTSPALRLEAPTRGAPAADREPAAEPGAPGRVDSTAAGGPASWGRTPAYVAWGIGGAALLTGTGTGIAALRLADQLKDRCGGMSCPPSERERVEDLGRLTTVSNVSFAIAAAGAVGGAVWFWLTSGDAAPPKDAARKGRILPWAGPESTGVALTGAW
jgi:hypothetical protein